MKPTPYLPGAIRKHLADNPEFVDLLHGGTITTREVPDPLTRPHVTVAAVSNQGEDPMLRRLMIQVTPWVPGRDLSGLDEDPDVTAWNLAAMAGNILGRAKNVTIDADTAWNATWVDGPIQLYDKTRGADRIIYYAPIRLRVKLRDRRTIIIN